MSLKLRAKDILRQFLASQGYQIRNSESYRARMDSALQSVRNRGHSVRTVIDVGASDGHWSAMAMRYLNDCNYLLIEAQPTHKDALEKFCSTHSAAEFVLAAAGDSPGEIYFDASAPMLGQASHRPFPHNNLIVPVTTIDAEVSRRHIPGPYLIKLDTHGFEEPILQGARTVLRETQVLIIECYNFKIAPEGLLFYEMCQHMKGLGFRCIDLVDPRHRLRDGVFWQADLVFVPADRQEFEDPSFDGEFGRTWEAL